MDLMPSRVVDKDNGAKVLMRNASKVRRSSLKVGIVGGDGDKRYQGGATLAEVATWMEFGTINCPERSFIRAYVDLHEQEIKGFLDRAVKRDLSRERDMLVSLDLIGQQVVGGIKERIADGIAPALSEETVERKGSTTPLIDTGQLRGSISYVVEP